MASPGFSAVVRFGDFEFDVSSSELRKSGIRLKVPDQSLQILAMLLERPGELVSRGAIQARLWPNGTVVEFEHSVNSAIKRLRQALLDTANERRFVETLTRKGYRFIGVLEAGPDKRTGVTPGSVLAPGTRLGPYELLAPIGKGGMGEVWKALDTRLNRMVAVKRLESRHSDRFDKEARAIAALNHPNICQIHDVGSDYLVLELIEGKPLSCPYLPEKALHLAIQIAGALEVAHRKGIIHRDLKPANIMVTDDGAVKLLDFGLAKLIGGSDATHTLDGTVAGTAAYMSPEQAEGRPLDERSDIFSFGAVLYEILSGRRAFAGSSFASALSAVLRDDPRPLEAPAAMERIVMCCLRKNPGDRYQSIAEVKAELSRISLHSDEQRASIAVLPFANMSRDPDDDYFSDGLAEEIICALAQTPDLKVIARTSAFAFKGQNTDIRKIAEALGVTTILEGSVRRADNHIRVTAQLIRAADGTHLWSQRYDRQITDVFAIQDEIARAIARSLEVKLGARAAGHHQHKPKLPAYEAFLRGRHHLFKFNPESWQRAKERFQEAVELDPEYAQPHANLGYGYLQAGAGGIEDLPALAPVIRAEAQKALEIDPDEPEPRFLLGSVAAAHDYDWAEAGRQFQAAVARPRASAEAHWAYASLYLQPLGIFREAVVEMDLAVEQDPLNVHWRAVRSSHLVHVGMAERAVEGAMKTLELNENYWVTHFVLAEAYLAMEMPEKALAATERAYQSAPWQTSNLGLLAGLLFQAHENARAKELVRQLEAAPGATFGRVLYHLMCSEMDAAADWYEKAVEQRELFAIIFASAPMIRDLRVTSRWPKLAKMMNLP
jgi:serine/threonine protein kinase/tetratricopeptide (TPR) repeat protein